MYALFSTRIALNRRNDDGGDEDEEEESANEIFKRPPFTRTFRASTRHRSRRRREGAAVLFVSSLIDM